MELLAFNVLGGESRIAFKFPFLIGRDATCDFVSDDIHVHRHHCAISQQGSRYILRAVHEQGDMLVDGVPATEELLVPGKDYTLVIGKTCLVFRIGKDLEAWFSGVDLQWWYLVNPTEGDRQGPFDIMALAQRLNGSNGEYEGYIMHPVGVGMGFYATHMRPALKEMSEGNPSVTAMPPLPDSRFQPPPSPVPQQRQSDPIDVNAETGEFTCPVCWLRFDRGDIMHVAVHPDLRGDPMLPNHQMQRFRATRFNDRGQALDPMGIATSDTACPHCRRKLPPGFLDVPHHILSIVGAPQSGKSYYLSVLIKTLQQTLYKQFGASLRDSDPEQNAQLNDMKNRLFSSSTPEEAHLSKTQLEGEMYETLPRQGRLVRLPKPFIFHVSHDHHKDSDFSLVFYDNAGEHFEPGRNSADSPGAQHIAAASGILFLFDPIYSTEFKKRIRNTSDPQLQQRLVDQQDILLAEAEVRIKNILAMDQRSRIPTPLAVVLGKCDIWIDEIGREKIQDPVVAGKLDQRIVDANSRLLREFLLEIHSPIISNAEAISATVRYFAASPLGSSPVRFVTADGDEGIGPDPARIKPMFVEPPVLWLLSKLTPKIVPSA